MKKIIVYTFKGLGDEYKKLVITIRAHDSLISFVELYDKLIGHKSEMRKE